MDCGPLLKGGTASSQNVTMVDFAYSLATEKRESDWPGRPVGLVHGPCRGDRLTPPSAPTPELYLAGPGDWCLALTVASGT